MEREKFIQIGIECNSIYCNRLERRKETKYPYFIGWYDSNIVFISDINVKLEYRFSNGNTKSYVLKKVTK